MKKIFALYFIIFLEGYIVLSSELLAMRQIIPFVGNGTDTVAIIIAAVLLPLAVGYYIGSKYSQRQNFKIREKLLNNILIASLFLVPGISYFVMSWFFELLSDIGLSNRLISTSIYATIFLVTPVYLLAQTIPLAANFFRKDTLSVGTGKMLFFSTLGSFLGATFTTLFLMAVVGVFATVCITLVCLGVIYFILNKDIKSFKSAVMVVLCLISVGLNSRPVMDAMGIIEANQQHTVTISHQAHNKKVLHLNNSSSSGYYDNQYYSLRDRSNAFEYVKFVNTTFIDPLLIGNMPKKSILIIGAGGFTMGLHDTKNDYVFLDIDKNLKRISEEHFLKQKLSLNKKFVVEPARGYLYQAAQENMTFDLIVVDTYFGKSTVPEHLLTKEFFISVKERLSDDGILVMNVIDSPTFSDKLTIRINNTLYSVFDNLTRHIVKPFNGWNTDPKKAENSLYIYYNRPIDKSIYDDDKNTVHYDRKTSIN